MADITISCPQCRTAVTVSEFADFASIACRQCGASMAGAGAQQHRPPTPALKTDPPPEPPPEEAPRNGGRKRRGRQEREQAAATPAPAPAEEAGTTEESVFLAIEERRARGPRREFKMTYHLATWLVFLGLGAVCLLLRYGGLLPQIYLDMIPVHGPVVVIGIHIFICLRAFKDSIFHGILCLLIPLYSVYYLFTQDDDFYARAVIGALLLGIGWDSGLVIMEWVVDVYHYIDAWIGTGAEAPVFKG